MKKKTAYQCEFCKKLLINQTQMKNHELICFKNPLSKSCITCANLSLTNVLNGKLLTQRESDLMQYKIEGTYIHITCGDSGESGYILNDEYKYLYDCDVENYCESKEILLKKLRTNCNSYQTKNP